MPLAKGSLSTSIICRRMATPTSTPTAPMRKVQSASCVQESVCPVRSVMAGMAETRPALEMDAPALAPVWLMLFSELLEARRAGGLRRLPQPEAEQRGGDRHVEAPADLQPAVDVAEREHGAEHGARQDGAQRQLAGSVDGGHGAGCYPGEAG
ncbi:MAG: hypothetical protein M5U28_17720 [Sandaracinaceae bacterium]|nr:hypothetical protein [Sandaracinaceae bacterium]